MDSRLQHGGQERGAHDEVDEAGFRNLAGWRPFVQRTATVSGLAAFCAYHCERGVSHVHTASIRMPLGEFSRRMTAVRLRDRRLVIFQRDRALDEEEMRLP